MSTGIFAKLKSYISIVIPLLGIVGLFIGHDVFYTVLGDNTISEFQSQIDQQCKAT